MVEKTGQRFKFNLLSVINNKGEMRFMLTEQMVDKDLIIEFLKRLMAGQSKPVFLVLDGHLVHRSRAVKEFAAATGGKLRIFCLPPIRLRSIRMSRFGTTSSTAASDASLCAQRISYASPFAAP